MPSSAFEKALKRDRHLPKSGKRGLPKKQGAGGKGTWGVPGDEIDVLLGDLSSEGSFAEQEDFYSGYPGDDLVSDLAQDSQESANKEAYAVTDEEEAEAHSPRRVEQIPPNLDPVTAELGTSLAADAQALRESGSPRSPRRDLPVTSIPSLPVREEREEPVQVELPSLRGKRQRIAPETTPSPAGEPFDIIEPDESEVLAHGHHVFPPPPSDGAPAGAPVCALLPGPAQEDPTQAPSSTPTKTPSSTPIPIGDIPVDQEKPFTHSVDSLPRMSVTYYL